MLGQMKHSRLPPRMFSWSVSLDFQDHDTNHFGSHNTADCDSALGCIPLAAVIQTALGHIPLLTVIQTALGHIPLLTVIQTALGHIPLLIVIQTALCNKNYGTGGLFVSIIIIITYPLTARVVGAPQINSQPVSSIFPFSTALWELAHSRPVHSLMLSSHIFLCLPCLLPPFTVLCKMVWSDLMNGRHEYTTAVCISLQWSGGLHVVQLPAGSWHRLSRW